MKIKIYIGCAIATMIGVSSCNDALDMEPVSQITPESYYQNADQLQAYMNNYYTSYITGPYSGLTHTAGAWSDGMASSDANTDIFISGTSGNTGLFADNQWSVSSDKVLQGYYGQIRAMNNVIEQAMTNISNGTISKDDAEAISAIGEAYFLRAMCYFNLMVNYGDAPIVNKVLDNTDDAIVPASVRSPRTEVSDSILADLDRAISMLLDRSVYQGQRINKQAAQVFKSRVALFEATFEKYHKGSGRVPGDDKWPGNNMSYNQNKSFDIDGHIKNLLKQAMDAAQPVADAAQLTQNNGKLDPTVTYTKKNGQIQWKDGDPVFTCTDFTSFNPYFQMYSQPSLATNEEVLLWREYSKAQSLVTDVPYRVLIGSGDGFTRNFVQSFLCQDGMPIYVSNSYLGDRNLDNVVANRDLRLQLFMWADSRFMGADPDDNNGGYLWGSLDDDLGTGYPNIIGSNTETRCVTGYQPRKYFTYDAAQIPNDTRLGTNACPIFRSAEAMLNYMEADVELNGKLSTTAKGYWQRLRARAGVSTDVEATISVTDLDEEYNHGQGDFAVYSGTSKVSTLLYNIRRERMNETFCEGFRRMDLVRWRSYDMMIASRNNSWKWVPEGMNFWAEQYQHVKDWWVGSGSFHNDGKLISDGSSKATVSSAELSTYLCPWSRVHENNLLYEGCNWHEAYYLSPLGVEDLRTASADRTVENSNLYQNPFWPSTGGSKALE